MKNREKSLVSSGPEHSLKIKVSRAREREIQFKEELGKAEKGLVLISLNLATRLQRGRNVPGKENQREPMSKKTQAKVWVQIHRKDGGTPEKREGRPKKQHASK